MADSNKPWLAMLSRPPVRWGLGLGLALVAGFGLGQLGRRPAAPELAPSVRAAAPKPQPQLVGALGRLEPGGEVVKLAMPQEGFAPGLLSEVRVREGQRVRAGEVLALLDNRDDLQAQLDAARSAVAIAQAQLRLVEAGPKRGEVAAQQQQIRKLTSELAIATTEYRRNQALFGQGAVSATQLDSKRLEVERLRGELEVARATLNKVEEIRPEDLQLARAQLAQAQAQERKAAAALLNSEIRAPFAGQVLKIHTRPGETQSKDGVLELARTQDMEVVAEVYETDVGRIRVGQPVTVTAENGGFSGTLQGRVSRIGGKIGKKDVLSTDPTADVDARVVEVHIELAPRDRQRVANLTNLQVMVRINAAANPAS